ncbi:MAG: carbohydrate ABC transporter permease, partial [Acidisphaera sp.]|nr:carbohydrate ABC transporter permease [Acidisphaera sp.]
VVNLALRGSTASDAALSPTRQPTLANFVEAWRTGALGPAMFTTASVVTVSVAALVVIAALASYPLARATTRFSRSVYMLFMLGLLLPYQLVFIPLYQNFSHLGLLGPRAPVALVIFYVGHALPFSILLFTSFLRAIPIDYENAASLDGCSRLQAFRHVLFPLLGPVTGTVVILNTIFVWNDFMTPLLYLSGSGNLTLPVAIYSFVGEYSADWPKIFAGLLIGVAPVMCAYVVLQRRIMQGFSGGLTG